MTGPSGAGKTKEISRVVKLFNQSAIPLPDDRTASIVPSVLNRKAGWKYLGRDTLSAMKYPLSEKARLTQPEIWQRVVTQARLQGILGIHYDEVQHIFMGRSEEDVGAILDSFKTLLKSIEWPIMLIMSGVPELAGFVNQLDQVVRKITRVNLEDIDPTSDLATLNDIVGSYAIKAGLSASADLSTGDFLHRLAVGSALRWGLAIEITEKALDIAKMEGRGNLTRQHFVAIWTDKTKMHPAATPFTHAGYKTVFRKDAPFTAFV